MPGRFSVVAVETGSKTPVPGSGRDADVLWSPSVGEEVEGSRNGSTTRSADQRKKAQRKNLPQLWGYRAEPPDLRQDPVSVACGGLTVPPPRGHILCLQRPHSVNVGHVATAHASSEAAACGVVYDSPAAEQLPLPTFARFTIPPPKTHPKSMHI